ncbi:hypothetical protein [Parvularcula sp. IMCC14364]|uniref:hypothetical protein n=1 Tax=Parvularcula sp. IMCC14364 TaxID=3067902 RepID=UPI00274231AA|nr:hypothetical protein [Parvularcula sp. IMCC14364]
MDHPEIREDEKSVWEKPGTIRVIWLLLIIGCVLFASAGFLLAAQGQLVYKPHFEDKTGIAAFFGNMADNFPAFYALVGFVSFSFIVLVGQHLRKILMRPEDYYDSPEAEGDDKEIEA